MTRWESSHKDNYFLLVVGTKYEPLMLMSPKILAYAGAWIDVLLCQETTISIR